MITFIKLFLGPMYIIDGVCLTLTLGNYKPGLGLWCARKIAMFRFNNLFNEK